MTGLTAALAAKQDTLTAGEGISIEGNVISSTGGGGDVVVQSSYTLTFKNLYEAVGDFKLKFLDEVDGGLHVYDSQGTDLGQFTGNPEEPTAFVTKAYVDEAIAGGGSYTLPMASASTLGGVKVGSSSGAIGITADGTIQASPYLAEISYQDSNRTIYFEKTATSGSAADISFRLLDGGNLRVVSDAAAAWGSTYDTELASKTYVDTPKPLTSGDTLSPITVMAGVEIIGEDANHLSVTPWDNGEIHMLRFEHKAANGYDYTTYFTFVGDRRMEADGIYHLRCYSFGGKVYAEVIHREGE